jgi:hypothetical protein
VRRSLPRTEGRLGILSEYDENPSDVLNRLRPGAATDFFQERFAGGPIGVPSTNLDQLVSFQAALDFRQNRGRQTSTADQHHRVESVRSRLQFAPPGG